MKDDVAVRVLLLVICLAETLIASGRGNVLRDELASRHFVLFNENDDELYTNAIPNAAAVQNFAPKIPLFECPDEMIERTYYFRWWVYRKHLRKSKFGEWVVTEFMPNVDWAGPENTIACPLEHHLREGRWLRDPEYIDGYISFMLEKGRINGPGSYVNGPAWSSFERAKVTGDFNFLRRHFPEFVKNFEIWMTGWKVESMSLQSVENVRGAIPVLIKGGFRPERGLFDFAGNCEGTEFALSADGARPFVNAMMWGEASAITAIAHLCGESDVADRFSKIAENLERSIKRRLWNAEKQFFTTLSVKGVLDDVCELHGYAPFYFCMELKGFENAWEPLMREKGFYAEKGLSFPMRDTPGFDLSYDSNRHECLWNGPSWPYATSIALTALYESIQRGLKISVDAEDFFNLVRQYAMQHVLRLPGGQVVPWIDENLDPISGEWLARSNLIEWDRQGVRKMKYRERGKDYNHSTFCDLVIAGLCGFVPQTDGRVVVRPLAPKTWRWWCVDGIRYHGRDVTVLFDRDGLHYGRGPGLIVLLDGQIAERSKDGEIEEARIL